MLSNAEVILLSLIKSKPSYAYEVEKKIEEKGVRRWVKIGGPTVYQVLDRLCRKGLLDFDIEKEGRMPSRKRYRITGDGNKLLVQAAVTLLENNEFYYFDLSLALACRQFLNPDDFRGAVGRRLDKLNSFLEGFTEKFEKSKELYPEKRHLVKNYLLSHYKLEQAFLETLLGETNHDNI